jgi:rRNA maturation protein Nop10
MRLALTLAATAIACGSATPPPVPATQRFDDDYEAARLAAVRAHLPLAVEVWAPW